ncbi:MAG: hypothetical protein ABIR96_11730, partial [Bdellovibrionota bacterium]
QAILSGSADFFVAAFRRSDQLFRYSTTNLYPLYPNIYYPPLAGKARDPLNSLFIPNAYSMKDASDLGRILSGAMNDYRKALNGQSVPKLLYSADITGLAPASAYDSNTSWDLSVGVLFEAFHMLSTTSQDITLNGFAANLLETCFSQVVPCDGTILQDVLQNRGLLTERYFNPTKFSSQKPGEQNYTTAGGAGTANAFLFQIGKKAFSNDQAEDRWGLYMREDLGWAPYMPGGSTAFANDDGLLNPCETIIVFPHIVNNTNADKWKAARANTGGAPFAGFPLSSFIASFDSILPITVRGIDISDLQWNIAATPLGLNNFEDPDLGYPDPFSHVDANDWRGIPILKPGEDTQGLIKPASSRIYGVQQEKAFDLATSAKSISDPANVTKLRSAAGWIFKLGATPPDPGNISASVTFKIKYNAYNTGTLHSESTVHYFKGSATAPTLDAADPGESTVTQSLTMSATSGGFCPQ